MAQSLVFDVVVSTAVKTSLSESCFIRERLGNVETRRYFKACFKMCAKLLS
jgi:hypothetical protein